MANNIDLQKFCTAGWYRRELQQPFTIGKFTYATNGHIAIRVPKRPDVPKREGAPDASKVFANKIESAGLIDIDLPPEERKACECEESEDRVECDGRGYTSKYDDLSVEISGSAFQAKYVSLLLELPNLKVAGSINTSGTLAFRFDGGEGRLMPLKGPSKTHIAAVKNENKPNQHVVAMHLTAMLMPALVKQAKIEAALTATAERGELKKSEARLLNWAKFLVEQPEMSTFQTVMMIIDMIAMDYPAIADKLSDLPSADE